MVRELTVAVRMNKQGNNKWKKKLKQQEGLEMAGGQRMSAGCSETLRKASLGSRHTLRRKWGSAGGHSLQKNRCKGFSASYFCILLIFQLSKADCPKQHSEELACSFLEACLAQSLCLQLPCILLTGVFHDPWKNQL